MYGNHEGGVKRILNSAIGTVDHCYQRVTFKLRIRFETAIVSDHTSRYFKIFQLHLNIFPISETTVTEPQLYYIRTADCSHPNRLWLGWLGIWVHAFFEPTSTNSFLPGFVWFTLLKLSMMIVSPITLPAALHSHMTHSCDPINPGELTTICATFMIGSSPWNVPWDSPMLHTPHFCAIPSASSKRMVTFGGRISKAVIK